jgi:endonuclease/exonuclease/phosphatase family metal-dependent hydrolase
MLTVTTWNLQNLFPAGHIDGPKTQQAYDEKLDGLAGALTTLDPDVALFQEVGDITSLGDLLDRVGGTWHTLMSSHPDGRGIRVAIATRAVLQLEGEFDALAPGLGEVRVADDDDVMAHPPNAFMATVGRGVLHGSIRRNNRRLHLVTAHLKSKLLTFPGGRFQPHDEDERARYATFALHRRAVEAATLRIYLDSVLLDDGTNLGLVLAGDFNDSVDAATTQILQGPPGSEIGTPGELRDDKGDGNRLWNLAPLLPEGQRFSRVYRGSGELIDHIFVSRALLEDVQSVTSGLDPQAPPDLPSIDDEPHRLRDHPGSDHAPITATLS